MHCHEQRPPCYRLLPHGMLKNRSRNMKAVSKLLPISFGR
jgi:hypothetical protein